MTVTSLHGFLHGMLLHEKIMAQDVENKIRFLKVCCFNLKQRNTVEN